MFGKKEPEIKPVTKMVTPNSNVTNVTSVTYLAEDCEINGSLKAKGNARIDGKIEGKINVGGDLAVGQGALVKANIEARTISIAGEVHGNVQAKELLDLSSSARVYGDIQAKELKIDQGARFIGKSNFGDRNTTDSEKPETTEN